MKKLIILSIFVLFIGCLTVFAQRGGNRGPGQNRAGNTNVQNRTGRPQNRGKRRGQQNRKGRIFRGLDLSDDQRQQIREINSQARENGTDRETVINQIRGVLNDEQTEVFNQRLENAQQRRQQRQERQERRQQQENVENPPPPPPLPTNSN